MKESLTPYFQAFLEGNRLFRESRFDVAKSQYSRALSTLQEQLTDVEVWLKRN